MRILVNGVRLFFDVDGVSLLPDGPAMREKPTLLLLHGGPGFDHSIYKPVYSALADVAQVIYLDHRGNGRSEAGPTDLWTLAQWGDDVRAFCDALGIVRPIVLGVSFGGKVAMAYATRYPSHPSKLILISTEAQGGTHKDRRVAMFEKLGGPDVGAMAQRRMYGGHPDKASVDAWSRLALPLYTRAARNPDIPKRVVSNPDVLHWFTRPDGEDHTFNMIPDLARVQCPTLVMGGEEDPMTPIECQADIVAALPSNFVSFRRFAGCGHAVVPDAPEQAMAAIRAFILGSSSPGLPPEAIERQAGGPPRSSNG
jgi:pimeloyl-ACP methyl ester carboxylesterase